MAATPNKLNVLGYALLGLLSRGAQSGYDLAQGLKDPVSFFWHAQHSQIYPELAKLETAGLIEHTRVEQTERPDKKVYNLTSDGERAMRAWLETPTEVPKKRDELVLKAYSLWLSDPHAAAQMMREHAEKHAAHRTEFERRLEKLEQKFGKEIWQPDSPSFGIHAVLRRGIGFETEYETWCNWMAEALSAAPIPEH
jgi:DNA-binding PadR family transcriptional regulator